MQATVYNCNTTQQGTSGSIFAAEPMFNVSQVFCCSTPLLYYDPAPLELALQLLLQAGSMAGDELTQQSTYQYDLVALTSQVMSNRALELHTSAVAAFDHADVQGCSLT